LKLLKVKIEDFKCIKNLEKDVQGKNLILMGENGVGKSSFIQFIKLALGDTSKIPQLDDAKGYVVVDRDGQEYKFFVKMDKKKPKVTVETPDGFRDDRKSIIAQIVGAIDFDIDEFVKMSESASGRKQQVEIYKSFLDDEAKDYLFKIERNVQLDYDDRTEVNRKIKTLDGFIKEHPMHNSAHLNYDPIDINDISEQLKRGQTHNDQIKGVEARVAERDYQLQKNKDEIERLKASIIALEQENDILVQKNKEASEYIAKNAPTDLSELMDKMASAQRNNAIVEQARDYQAKLNEKRLLEEDVENMTIRIEASRQLIQDAVRDMEIVPGLSFDSEQLLFNGLPVSEASMSTSEIMELGVMLKMQKGLGILFLERGESLGTARLKRIQEMAEQNGWQLIMEQVERGQDKLLVEFM